MSGQNAGNEGKHLTPSPFHCPKVILFGVTWVLWVMAPGFRKGNLGSRLGNRCPLGFPLRDEEKSAWPSRAIRSRRCPDCSREILRRRRRGREAEKLGAKPHQESESPTSVPQMEPWEVETGTKTIGFLGRYHLVASKISPPGCGSKLNHQELDRRLNRPCFQGKPFWAYPTLDPQPCNWGFGGRIFSKKTSSSCLFSDAGRQRESSGEQGLSLLFACFLE